MGNVHMEATQINYRGGSKKMSVEEAIKAAGTEITPEEKTWIDSIPTLASGKADNDVIAPEFDSEAGVYAIGDLVMHEGKLYEFTTAHETAGEWDSTEVTEKTVADELNSLESGLIDLNTAIDITSQCTFDSTIMHEFKALKCGKIVTLCGITKSMQSSVIALVELPAAIKPIRNVLCGVYNNSNGTVLNGSISLTMSNNRLTYLGDAFTGYGEFTLTYIVG